MRLHVKEAQENSLSDMANTALLFHIGDIRIYMYASGLVTPKREGLGNTPVVCKQCTLMPGAAGAREKNGWKVPV